MKTLLILIMAIQLLLASNNSVNTHKVRILETIVKGITLQEKIVVWSDNNSLLSVLKKQNNIETSYKCINSTLIILEKNKNLKEECLSKKIFVLNYNLLSTIKKSFGALFWKKGRPNIVFIEPRLKSQSISISKDLESYLEDRVW